MEQQQFKVGQKVKVIEGWNIELDRYIKEVVENGVGEIVNVDKSHMYQPNIAVRYREHLILQCYPNPADKNRRLKVEIIEDVQDS